MNWVLGVAALLLTARAVSLWIWPYAPCRWCDGGRRNPGSNAERWGRCRGCGGTGERLRFGARTVQRAVASARRKH